MANNNKVFISSNERIVLIDEYLFDILETLLA
jgi:hypothetical protein